MDATPEKIEKIDDDEIKIIWRGGHETLFIARGLRLMCPCALCRDEWTGKALIDPGKVPQDLKVARAELVGNYALAFQFSDGHSQGIYTFDMLRENCACPSCAR